ncbi:MAG: PKD domain-containing protein [Acidobacteria bacterium]|nr:PKD domain-containing protein [Acidobacteriota bacterium]
MFRLSQKVSKPHYFWFSAALALALCVTAALYLHSSQAAETTAPMTIGTAAPSAPAASRTTTTTTRLAAPLEDQQQGCTVNCGATVPANGQANQAVAFTANVTTQGCSTQPTYQWDFGDGSPGSTQQNPSKAYTTAGTYTWRLTSTVSSGGTNIDTIAGGTGEGAPARQSPYVTPFAVAADTQNRGFFVMEYTGNSTVLRFVNTMNQPATLGGRTVDAGTNRILVGNGDDELTENHPGTSVALSEAHGLVAHPNGNLVYFVTQNPPRVRALNISSSNQTVGTRTVAPGNVATLAEIASAEFLNALAINASGDVFTASPVTNINRVYRITPSGQVSNFAGNGAVTQIESPFTAGPATSVALFQPRALEVDPNGNVFIADSSHQRVIRVDTSGNATLVTQFAVPQAGQGVYPCGLAFFSGSLYCVLGNSQTIVRIATGQQPVRIAGTDNSMACEYNTNSCGDGGPALNAGFSMLNSSGTPPLTSLDANSSGLLVPDQGSVTRGRVRFINLSSASATLAGTTVPALGVNTIAGNGLVPPYDGVNAIAAELRVTNGLALDANNNLWLADSSTGRLRFVNRGATSLTLFPGTAAAQIVPAGAIVTVNKDVGGGAGDNTTANFMSLNTPQGVFWTTSGLYLVDTLGAGSVGTGTAARKTGRVRFVNTTTAARTLYPNSSTPINVPVGGVVTIAGGGQDPAGIGNGGFALNAKLLAPSDIAVASNGDFYIADVGNKAVRKVLATTGVVSSLNLSASDYTGLGFDASGRLYIADNDGNRVLRENVANGGAFTSMTTETTLYGPRDVAVDAAGNAYVLNAARNSSDTNTNAHRIIRIAPGGATSVYAGTTQGFAGDGGPAASARLNLYSASVSLSIIGTGNFADTTINIVTNSTGEVFFSDIANGRIRRIAAGSSSCTRTGTIEITGGQNPVPTLASITPNSRGAGTQGNFTLTLTGTNFLASSVVRWNGQDRVTTFVNDTQLTAQILQNDVANVASIPVTVFNPAPGGGTSNAVSFSVQAQNPIPGLEGIIPNVITVNTPFRITVNGTGFRPNSVVRWEGQNRPTTFVSETQLTAQIPASDLTTPGNYDVSVFTPEPGGGSSGNARITVLATNPVPAITQLAPDVATVGGPAFTLTVNGTGFAFGSVVRWNGQDRQTTFLSSSQITAQISAADIATATTAAITVFSPTPGGGVTAPTNFIVGTAAVATSAASYAGVIAPDSIVALFGTGMATGIGFGATVPLPTTLLGTTVMVRDSLGTSRPAPLFFVAATQINFLVPKDTAPGASTIIIRAATARFRSRRPSLMPYNRPSSRSMLPAQAYPPRLPYG